MKTKENTIQCPQCGFEINVNQLIYHQLEEELSKKFKQDLTAEKKKYEDKASLLEEERRSVENERKRLAGAIEEGVDKGIKAERKRLEDQLRKKIDDEKSEQFKVMQEELERKTGQLKEFNKARSELARLKRENEELESTLRADLEKKYSDQLSAERAKIAKTQEEKSQLKLAEKEQIIEQLRDQLQEAQRKAEQGSMQLQGEVQELAIEEWLRSSFPLDTIEEVKKGALGADCLHTVNMRTRQNCGVIYYESKRTKGFQKTWTEKLKKDMRDKGVNIGVLVTETMPPDMERMGLKDGVWVCTFEEFKGLCCVLRESLIQISAIVTAQENKGEKMQILYDYLTSTEFRFQVEAIVEGFIQMQTDLESEKRSMQSIWKRREKQIEKVLLNTNNMYSSIKGIAGSAVQPIKQLELLSGDELEE